MRKLLFTLLSAFLPLAIWGAGYSFLSPKLDEVDQTHEPDVATLSAEASEVTAGEISNLTVSLENGDLVCNGYQFVLKLPEGITLAFDEEEDDWVYSLTNRYTKKKSMQFTVSDKGNGEYQILCYSMTNETITGSEGSIVTLGLQTDPSLAGGTYNCSLNNAIMSTVDGTSIDNGDIPFDVSVSSGTEAKLTMSAVANDVKAGEISNLTVSLNNGNVVCNGYQFVVKLPEGITLAFDEEEDDWVYSLTNRYTKKKSMQFTVSDKGNGEYQILCYSMTNETITGSEGPIVTFGLQTDPSLDGGTYNCCLTNVIASGVDGNSRTIDDVPFSMNVEGAPIVPITVTVKSYTRPYGDENPEFEFTVEGGELKGDPSITCSATKTSPVGEYVIEIAAGAVENSNVTYVNGTLTVEKAPLTVKAGDYTMKQGDPLPEFTATYEGFKNDETAEVLTKQPVLTTEATSSTAPGEYAVKASGAEALNYEISYVDGKLTITEADPITVTVKSYSRLYGDENPEFEYTVEGGELIGAPTITCSATKTSPVGEYAIEVSAGTVENFNVTYVNGTLKVEKAALTVKAGDYAMKQGDPLPEFTASFEGFKNGETAEVLTKQPELRTEASSDSEPGTYTVKVSGAEAQNYEISYVDGTLTIIEADAIIVRVNSYTRLYGEENPEFEFVVEGGELIGEPVITCEATKESSVGTYDIVISAGTVENFNVTYVNGTLTVDKAPLLVIANDCERVQFEENPVFTLRYEGFVNGDTEEVLTVKPVASTSATIDSEAGEYEIYVSGGEAENYELSYQSGTLTVHPYSGIVGVTLEHPVNVYSIQGVPVRMQTTSLVGLPRGVYIVEGRKVTVK